MKTPSEFDDIRPFDPEELPAVYDRLLANKQFQAVVHFLYPDTPMEAIAAKMRQCKTNIEFQKTFCYTFLNDLVKTQSRGCEMDFSALDASRCYTFMSNHRDIVLDAALLDKMLIDAKFTTTCEIAIGDNLLSIPWVLDIVRVNKSFIVKRGLMAREQLESSIKLSKYMHYAISEKKENLWIAQREGRAKDSDDRTQKAVLKMLALAGEGSVAERLKNLHIVPLAISYEFDPCDYLKAQEMQLRRDIKDYKKGENDDVNSMRIGITGYKGHIFYHCAPCIDDFLEQLPADMPNADIYNAVAEHIDRSIFKNYHLYPNNYIAEDMLEGSTKWADHYTDEDKATFEKYLEKQMAKIDIPGKDEPFLKTKMLLMYANPLRNHLTV